MKDVLVDSLVVYMELEMCPPSSSSYSLQSVKDFDGSETMTYALVTVSAVTKSYMQFTFSYETSQVESFISSFSAEYMHFGYSNGTRDVNFFISSFSYLLFHLIPQQILHCNYFSTDSD